MGALQGIKVLDITHFIAGPFCSQTLGDHGAEVIKIEPLEGEFSRKGIPMYGELSLYFASMNRNKRGLALNLKAEKGQKILHRLVKEADVLVTNYAPGAPERLGFGYEEISKINPRIIMTHITGFGLNGPYKNKSAFDGVVQSLSGIVHLTGEKDGPPMKAGLYIADHIAGMQGVTGTLLALYKREITGEGQLVDISMLDSMVSMLAYNLADVAVLNNSPHRAGNDSTNVFATTFQTKDGYVYIAPLTAKMWANLCRVIGHEEWAEKDSPYFTMSGRLSNYPYLKKQIESWTLRYSTIEVVTALEQAGVACAAVSRIEDVLNNPQLKAREMLLSLNMPQCDGVIVPGIPIKLNKSSKREVLRPPLLGEHTQQILMELGYSQSEVNDLLNERIIFQS